MEAREKLEAADSHVIEDTPATVGVTRAQALSTCAVLLTGLHGDLRHLQQSNDRKQEREANQKHFPVFIWFYKYLPCLSW